MDGQLWRVTAPWFVAGIIIRQDGVIIETAPILRKTCVGTTIAWFRGYCRRLGWGLEHAD